MKYEFLHKENSRRLIVIFAGWSTDSYFYRHITLPGWDLLIVSDYSDFDFDESILNGYRTIALFAWSLGVFAASRSFPFNRATLTVAINGTEYPIDDTLGIPKKIYDSTVSGLNEGNLRKFRRRMCGGAYDELLPTFTLNDIGILRSQLENVKNKSQISPVTHSRWNRVYISENDHIFPATSQKKAWERHPSEPEIISLNEPHYVDLGKIINALLPAKEKVGKRFHKALSTYDNQATAQKAIAERLKDLPGGVPRPLRKILEIGPGSGIFSRLFAERFHPDEYHFVELYPLLPFNISPKDIYFTCDAEDWLEERSKTNPESYDAVVSSSAIQWFADPDLFFRNASVILRPGGMLLCSTFIPGNLIEMAKTNPYGLIYRKTEELEKLLKKYFMFTKLEEEELIIQFDSPMDTLRHLKETGVGGGIPTGKSPRELLSTIPLQLTYRPLYIYAIKPDSNKFPDS